MEIRDLTGIERELQRLVFAASGTGIRASLFNLVVFEQAAEAGPPSPADTALGALFGSRPARILRVKDGHRARTEVDVSARCAAGLADRAVCFEEILIHGGEDALAGDPGCWTPLLITGLPVYLWWLESIEALGPFLQRVEESADRLIVDTGWREQAGEDPLQALRLLAGELEATPGLSDFTWRRTQPLRRWAARLFDPPENRESLECIEAVRLEGGLRSEGLLLFLWLAARLEWKAEDLGRDGGRFRDRSDRPLRLEHHPGPPLSEGFRLDFAVRDRPGLSVRCGADGCALLDNPDAGALPIHLKVPGDAEILLAEVDSLGVDPLYRQALRVLRQARSGHG